MTTHRLPVMVSERLTDGVAGVVSVCTSHPLAIEAALLDAARHNRRALIEATCNQVNQEGGYTGLSPTAFRILVEDIAQRVGFDRGRLVLGGDHLGPNPWKRLPAEEAMARAESMVAAYARAGFSKIHLDASMGCAGEPPALPDAIAAARAARLAEAAEAASPAGAICYVVGTEVPAPGGVGDDLHVDVTKPAAARATIEAHRQAFCARGLDSAFNRVIALVVQPGVEFGASEVVEYNPSKARELSDLLADYPQFVFEAHSTDYQPAEALRALVADGFAILKVGPALTFALRQALYGIDHIARTMFAGAEQTPLPTVMEKAMLEDPRHWRDYYGGDDVQQRLSRHYSLSDRIRYYWAKPEVQDAVERLLSRFDGREMPRPLLSQYMQGVFSGFTAKAQDSAYSLSLDAICRVLSEYQEACAPNAFQ